jgi:hypothetical protein
MSPHTSRVNGEPLLEAPRWGVRPVAIYPIVYVNDPIRPKTAPLGAYYSLTKLYTARVDIFFEGKYSRR